MDMDFPPNTKKIGAYLQLKGVFNIQFAVKDNIVYIIEVNPRASRTLPFLCKVTGLPLIDIATQCIMGQSLKSLGLLETPELPYYYVKESVLPFIKFPNANPLLGPEMKSTGEVMGTGSTFEEAYAKTQIAAGNHLPKSGNVYLVAAPSYNAKLQDIAKKLSQLGFKLFVQKACLDHFENKHHYQSVNAPAEIINCVLVIAIHDMANMNIAIAKDIRYALEKGICHVTSGGAASAIVSAILYQAKNNLAIHSLQENIHLVKSLKKPKHILTGEELTPDEIEKLLAKAIHLKNLRKTKQFSSALAGYHLALLFNKPSLRTRMSFTIGMRELGGDVIESIESTRKVETPEDEAGVLNGYCDVVMVRTHEDAHLARMKKTAKIPIINGLSALHHPCQIFADLMTLYEVFGCLSGLTLTYIGDGNNILHSLLLLAPQMGVNIHYCCPPTRGPDQTILATSMTKLGESTGKISAFSSPHEAAFNAHAVYTDVWTSMGFEDANENLFQGFQVNETLMQHALPNAIFMHCLPMERGKEVSTTLPDQPCSVIYQQSENRLHVQKALLLFLLKNEGFQHD